MVTKQRLIGLVALGALAGNAAPALAQVTENSQEVHVYVGEAFGDDLTDRRIAGRVPELEDDVTFGVRYGYNFTDAWGLELALGRTNTSVTKLASRADRR